MITPFDLRDVPLVRRLEGQGLALDAESSLTLGVHLLRHALAAYLALGGGGMPTYVLRKGHNGNGLSGLAQIRHRQGGERARIVYLAPALGELRDEVGQVWCGLLDHLTREAGARGAQSIVAEVPVDDPAVELLRTAGFAIYTRQKIHRLPGSEAPETARQPAVFAKDGDGLSVDLPQVRLRPRRSEDMWNISLLYANTAPRLLQLAEPPPGAHDSGWRRGYVLEDRRHREVVAYLEVKQGPAGVWIKAWLHPDAEDRADDLIAGALHLARAGRPRPVFWCVRRYQDWLSESLAAHGFDLWGSQAVMVKHTVARVEAPEAERELARGLENRAKVAMPMMKAMKARGVPPPARQS
jgi:ribosomal protein S18 acetylase RimI-like enzyme